MKKLICLIFLSICLTSYSQDFEGTVDYKLTYDLKPEKAADTTYFKSEFGTKSTFTCKEGKFKQVTDSPIMSYQLYIPEENRLYFTDNVTPDDLFYYQTNEFKNSEHHIEIVKNAATIAGYNCDKLIYTNNKSHVEFYFEPELKFNPKYFKEFYLSDKNELLKEMKSVFLRAVYFYPNFTATMEATAVHRMKIADSEFEKPAHKVVRQKKL